MLDAKSSNLKMVHEIFMRKTMKEMLSQKSEVDGFRFKVIHLEQKKIWIADLLA